MSDYGLSATDRDWLEKEQALEDGIRSERYDELGDERMNRIWLDDNASCVRPRSKAERAAMQLRYRIENGLTEWPTMDEVEVLRSLPPRPDPNRRAA